MIIYRAKLFAKRLKALDCSFLKQVLCSHEVDSYEKKVQDLYIFLYSILKDNGQMKFKGIDH